MKDQMQNRWMVVGLIWAGVLCFLYWNGRLMTNIHRNQAHALYAKADKRFLDSNGPEIDQLIRKKEAFHHTVASLKLGLLMVEDQLNTLMARHALYDVKINMPPGQQENDSVPIHLTFKGSIDNTLQFLDTLQKKFSYFTVDKAALRMDKSQQEISFTILLTYRYKVASPGDAA